MKAVQLPDGTRIPALGQGTWRIGENERAHEVAALRLGIELGIEDQRDRVFVVTKLTKEDLADVDREFPPPNPKRNYPCCEKSIDGK